MKKYILISDSQELFKESVAAVINEIDKKYICKYCCSYKILKQDSEALDKQVKLVILGTNLNDIENINEAVSGLTKLTKAPVLVVTSINNRFLSEEVINSGAIACLLKTTSHEKCKQVMKNILSGKEIKFEELPNTLSKISKLTKRQYEVLIGITQGMLNKQIAYKLKISESTVKIHISSILIKLAVNNRTEAVVKFYQETRQLPKPDA